MVEVDLNQHLEKMRSTERGILTHNLIVATGATAKRLAIHDEEKFWSRGISACAICDGATPIFKNQELAIVKDGDTAAEEALHLTKYGSLIHILVRLRGMRAGKTL